MENRDSREPELLLEADGEVPIVLERKSVVWPTDYFSNLGNERDLFEGIVKLLRPHFPESVYQLRISERSIHGLKKRQVGAIAQQIASEILKSKGKASLERQIAAQTPIPWAFGPLPEDQRDDTTPQNGIGLLVIGDDELSLDIPAVQRAAKIGFAEAYTRTLNAAALKLVKYCNSLNIFLVQFHGGDFFLSDSDVRDIIRSAGLSGNINEVWCAEPDWVSEYNYRVVWERVL